MEPEPWWRRAARLVESGDHDAALSLLELTLEEDGLWRTHPLTSTWFNAIRDDPRFQAVETGAKARAVALGTRPKLHVFPPAGAPAKPPLLLGLHGATSRAADFWPAWLPVTELGYLLAVPQSSQPAAPDAFCWDDAELAEAELTEHARTLEATHDFDSTRIVLAGFSQGAALAFRLAQRAVPFDARRFLLAAPSLFGPPIDPERAPKLRGAVVRGDLDPYGEAFPAFEESCAKAGLPLTIELVQGLGHTYPEDFPARLARLLKRLT